MKDEHADRYINYKIHAMARLRKHECLAIYYNFRTTIQRRMETRRGVSITTSISTITLIQA